MRMPTSLRASAITLVLALGLAACGGDDDEAAITSLSDLSGRALGVQSATTGEDYAEENAPEGTEITAFENPGDLFTALRSGQIDAILQDLPVNAEFARTNEGFTVVETYDTEEQYGFAVTEEGAEDLLEAVNAALGQLRGDGFYDAVFDKYFATEEPTDALPDVEPDEELSATEYDLREPGTLTVCSDIPYEPFEFEDEETGEFTGFDIELVGAVAAKLGLELEVVAIGFDPIQSGVALNSGQCDIAASAMTITEDREENLDFSDPYYDAAQSLLVMDEA